MELLFVYNADSGLLNTAKDIGHKLFSPNTYDCFLCSLTHGTFRENPKWKSFRQNSATEMSFLHRDEFEQQYDRVLDYPVVLENNDALQIVISKDQLSTFSSLEDLIEVVKQLEKKDKVSGSGE